MQIARCAYVAFCSFSYFQVWRWQLRKAWSLPSLKHFSLNICFEWVHTFGNGNIASFLLYEFNDYLCFGGFQFDKFGFPTQLVTFRKSSVWIACRLAYFVSSLVATSILFSSSTKDSNLTRQFVENSGISCSVTQNGFHTPINNTTIQALLYILHKFFLHVQLN